MMIWLVGSGRWTLPLPINAYVIEHADGLVLFDTGQDRASVTDPGYFPGGVTGFLYGRLARFQIAPQDTLVARLAALGHSASDVRPEDSEPLADHGASGQRHDRLGEEQEEKEEPADTVLAEGVQGG
jgi:hypothetical protein